MNGGPQCLRAGAGWIYATITAAVLVIATPAAPLTPTSALIIIRQGALRREAILSIILMEVL
jgi:hypothetical protein